MVNDIPLSPHPAQDCQKQGEKYQFINPTISVAPGRQAEPESPVKPSGRTELCMRRADVQAGPDFCHLQDSVLDLSQKLGIAATKQGHSSEAAS